MLARAVLSVHAAGTEPILRIGLIGCGGRGTGAVVDVLLATAGRGRLWAMADAFPDRMERSLGVLQRQQAAGVTDLLDRYSRAAVSRP